MGKGVGGFFAYGRGKFIDGHYLIRAGFLSLKSSYAVLGMAKGYGVSDKNDLRFEREYERLAQMMPKWAARTLAWLRQPYARLVRIPIGIIFTLGGIFSILPFLGVWMLPIGLILLAVDLPFLRGPVAATLVRLRHWWERWRKRK